MTVYELVERWIPCLCNDHYTVFIVFDNDYRSEQKPPITMHKNEWLNCSQDVADLKVGMFDTYNYHGEPTIRIDVDE